MSYLTEIWPILLVITLVTGSINAIGCILLHNKRKMLPDPSQFKQGIGARIIQALISWIFILSAIACVIGMVL